MTEQTTDYSTEQADKDTETKEQTTPETHSETKEQKIPKSRFDEVNQQKNELNDTLKGLVDELKQDIPEEYQDLIPDTKPQEQIKWIRNARKKGLFTPKTADSPDSETPKSGKDTEPDYSNMSSSELFENYFNKPK